MPIGLLVFWIVVDAMVAYLAAGCAAAGAVGRGGGLLCGAERHTGAGGDLDRAADRDAGPERDAHGAAARPGALLGGLFTDRL